MPNGRFQLQNVANKRKYHAEWKVPAPKCCKWKVNWKVPAPKCCKLLAKWIKLEGSSSQKLQLAWKMGTARNQKNAKSKLSRQETPNSVDDDDDDEEEDEDGDEEEDEDDDDDDDDHDHDGVVDDDGVGDDDGDVVVDDDDDDDVGDDDGDDDDDCSNQVYNFSFVLSAPVAHQLYFSVYRSRALYGAQM